MMPVRDFAVHPIRAGGGVWCFWIIPDDPDFARVRILRKRTVDGPISGHDDVTATVVLDGVGLPSAEYRAVFRPVPPLNPGEARRVLDLSSAFEQAYAYAIYAMNADGDDVSDPVTVEVETPDILELDEPDLKRIMMDFLDMGLARSLAKGTLKISSKTAERIDRIDVREAPPRIEEVTFPCVSVHLDDDQPAEYGIGDITEEVDADGQFGSVGYLSTMTLAIGGWAGSNPDVRWHFYRVLKALLMTSRSMLTEAGAEKVEVSGGEREEFESYDMPMYYCEFKVRLWVRSRVARTILPRITDIGVEQVTV